MSWRRDRVVRVRCSCVDVTAIRKCKAYTKVAAGRSRLAALIPVRRARRESREVTFFGHVASVIRSFFDAIIAPGSDRRRRRPARTSAADGAVTGN